jgi:hypothetical protein
MNTQKSMLAIGITMALVLQGCATMDSLKKEAGYGIAPAGSCEVQKNWQTIATSTDFVKVAKEQSSIVTVRLMPKWAVQNGIGYDTKDENGVEKNIPVRLVWEAIFFPKTGGYGTYYGYPTTDMKFLNVVVPGKAKAYFDGGSWLFPSGSYRSAMTANGMKSEIVPVKLSKEDGCFETFDSKTFFKAHPSQKVSVRDTISDGEAVNFLLTSLGQQFAQDFSVADKKFFTASQDDVVRAAGVSNESTGLNYALNNQHVPIHALAFLNPITAGLQTIPIAIFLYKVFDGQHTLRGSFPESTLTREEASEFFGKVLGENQNQAAFASQKAQQLQQELQKLKQSQQ